MKNTLVFFLCCMLHSSMGFAQADLLKTEKVVIEVDLNLIENQFTVNTPSKSNDESIVSVKNVRLDEKEILLDLVPLELPGTQYYQVRLTASLNGEALTISPENLLGDLVEAIPVEKVNQSQSLIWTNLVEDYLNLKGKLTLTIVTEAYGKQILPFKVDCGVVPTFTGKQRMPFLLVGLVGAGGLVAGEFFQNASAKDYDSYLRQESQALAEPFYDSANRKNHLSIISTYAGAGLILGDLVWYLIRQRRYKRQLDTYRKFCQPESSLSLRPTIGLHAGGAFAMQAGMTLNLRF